MVGVAAGRVIASVANGKFFIYRPVSEDISHPMCHDKSSIPTSPSVPIPIDITLPKPAFIFSKFSYIGPKSFRTIAFPQSKTSMTAILLDKFFGNKVFLTNGADAGRLGHTALPFKCCHSPAVRSSAGFFRVLNKLIIPFLRLNYNN
jgi:hypothetical protein